MLLAAGCGAEPAVTGREASTSPPDDGRLTPGEYAEDLLAGTMRVRKREGLPAVEESACLRDKAVERAERLAGEDLEHLPLDDVAEECAPEARVGENLSSAARPPAEVVEAWMGSPGHRNNIIDPGHDRIGVGCVADGERTVCVQLFADLAD